MKELGLATVKTWVRKVFEPLATIHYEDMKAIYLSGGGLPDFIPVDSSTSPPSPHADSSRFTATSHSTRNSQLDFPAERIVMESFYAQPNPIDISYVPYLEIWRAKRPGRSLSFTFGPSRGPAHAPSFTCELEVTGWTLSDGGQPVFFGMGLTKKASKNRAAQEAVELMALRVRLAYLGVIRY